MSVIVAIKDKDKVYLGADSQVTAGSTRTTLSNPNNYKIWKVRGTEKCVMGAVGMVRDACAVRILDGLVREIDEIHDDIDYEYVMNRIVPMITDELIDRKFIPSENPYKEIDSTFLFAYRDKFYTISNGAVIEHDDFAAIGSGSPEAIGSLLTSQGEKPERRIIKAIKASATNDIYVDYPIILTDTESTKFKVITDKEDRKQNEI